MTAGRFGRPLAVAGLALSLTACGRDPGRPARRVRIATSQVDLPKSHVRSRDRGPHGLDRDVDEP